MRMLSRCGLALLVALALGACESVNLIELNGNYAELSAQAADAKRNWSAGDISETEYEALLEVNREAFAENGDLAVEGASEAASSRGKASFLNLAVRSYLGSASVADQKIPDLAEQGKELCRDAGLQGVNALPVTCGYFHIVTAQAVANEATRRVQALGRKAVGNRVPGGSALSAEEGKELDAALNLLLTQIDVLEEAKAGIDFTNAAPEFAAVIPRQKVIFYCNADRAHNWYDDAAESGPGWNREAKKADAMKRLDAVARALGSEDQPVVCD